MSNQKASPKEVADMYEKEFGFMCINALFKSAGIIVELGAENLIPEMRTIYYVLVARGWKPILNKEEYDVNCQIYGIPKSFQYQQDHK